MSPPYKLSPYGQSARQTQGAHPDVKHPVFHVKPNSTDNQHQPA